LRTSIRKAKSVGAIVQGCISYTISPVHTLKYYMKVVEELLHLDVDIITIKDMAGMISPHAAKELISEIKSRFKVPVNLHTHSTGGTPVAAYLEAVRAGVDYIDTAISPLAFGTAQPGIQSVLYALPDNMRPTLNKAIIEKVSRYLRKLLETKYRDLLNPFVALPNPDVIEHQIPGGMMSNLVSQLRQANSLHRLDEVLEEVPRVRKDLGYPPLVTPLSQIVGTQAVVNVLSGGRYKVVIDEVKRYMKGLYGRPPGKINPELMKKVLGNEKPITVRPADLLKPQLEECRKKLKELNLGKSEEDVLSYCLFPDVAINFFK
jgi:pyruvate carboxylase subunit B